MLKKVHFKNTSLAVLLLFPQLLITLLFFIWPAFQALKQAFLLSDPFGGGVQFVWFDNFVSLFQDEEYFESFKITMIFSFGTAFFSLSFGLFFAVLANRLRKGKNLVQSILIWPYAIAPAIAGILWMFMFHPSFGVIAFWLKAFGINWNPVLNSSQALVMVIVAASWKQISYNFVFFLGGLQAIPKSILEAAAIDGAGPFQRFWKIVFPLLSPTAFFLLVMNLVFAFFETFGIIHAVTQGGPGGATNILVYKVFADGFVGLNLGASAAQSVVLMFVTILLTIIQFKFIEKRVQYA